MIFAETFLFLHICRELRKHKTGESETFLLPYQWWSCSWASVFQKSEPSPSTRWMNRPCRPGPHPQWPSLRPLWEQSSPSVDWQTNETIQRSQSRPLTLSRSLCFSSTKVSDLIKSELYKKHMWEIVKLGFWWPVPLRLMCRWHEN